MGPLIGQKPRKWTYLVDNLFYIITISLSKEWLQEIHVSYTIYKSKKKLQIGEVEKFKILRNMNKTTFKSLINDIFKKTSHLQEPWEEAI